MLKNRIRITREELYKQVWSEPMIKLAKKYGLSDVGLRKRCKRLNIPLPQIGYWAKKEFGKEPPRPSLPPCESTEEIEFNIADEGLEERPVDREQLEEAEARIAFEKNERNKIQVPSTLRSLHPYVAQTKKVLESYTPGTFDHNEPFLRARGVEALALKVTKKCLKRALRISTALIKALNARGFTVSIDVIDTYSYHAKFKTSVDVLGETIEFGLRELLTQTRRELPPEEQRWRKYEFSYNASGRLALEINSWEAPRKVWRDGKKQRLEDCLNNFIIGLIKTAVEMRTWENERKIEARKREEAARRREEIARRREEEQARVNDLLRGAEDWNRSQQISAFIEAVRTKAIQKYGAIVPESDLDKWLTWANQQADRLDPLVESPASILDEG